MAYLPLANILHHKFRSVLNALGIGMAVCMLVTLGGLSRGSLLEIAERWESVDADVIVFPKGSGDGATLRSGSLLNDKYADVIRDKCGDDVARVVPVFLWPMKLAGQDQMVAGVAAEHWPALVGGRQLSDGHLPDREGKFARWIRGQILAPADEDAAEFDPTPEDLAHPDHNGLEIVIDSRLARAGKYELNQVVEAAGHQWRIVGIVPAGGMTRVYMPRATAQFLFGGGNIRRSTLMFVKFKPGTDVRKARERLAEVTRQDVVPLEKYRGMLIAKFRILYVYVDAVNAVALTIAFLFIMNTLYTMMLERRREIAILKSCGAGWWFILRQVLAESLLLTFAGVAAGTALSFLAAWGIQRALPLLTVELTWTWYAVAAAAALTGAALSAIYPAWRATRVDMARTLSLE